MGTGLDWSIRKTVCKHRVCLEMTRICTETTSFPWKYSLHIFSPPRADLTSLIVPATSWKKINLKMFEILRSSLAWAGVYLSCCCGRERGSCWLRRYLFRLLLQTSWRVLAADGQKWDKPEAAVLSCFLPNCLFLCQVICFIFCYCGPLSYLVFWAFWKTLSSPERRRRRPYILPSAVRPVLLGGS